jgi:hypothetical protein
VSRKNEENIDESNTKNLLVACFAQFGEDLYLDKLLEKADVILESAPLVSSENEEAAIPKPPKKELKPLQYILKYKFLGQEDVLPVSRALVLLDAPEEKLPDVLREHKEANGWTIDDSKWVSPIHDVPKRDGLTIVKNKDDEFAPTHIQSRWRAWIDYHKVHTATRKAYFLRPFIDPMVEYLAWHECLRRPYWKILVTQSDCHLLWEVWLKIENLALVRGNPHSFTYHLILFVCFVLSFRSSVCHSSLGESSSMVHPTYIAHSVLYFWTHWGQCVILVCGWGRHFWLLFLLLFLLLLCDK